MFLPFNEMDLQSRLWIYQSTRSLKKEEVETIGDLLRKFCDRWAAHGQPLKTSFEIRENRFIILAADESHLNASGCSIDDSVRVIRDIDNHYQLGLFNRGLVAFWDQDVITLVPVKELKEKFTTGTWKGSTLTFNNLVGTKHQLENEWLVPAEQTWLKRYVRPQQVTN